MTEILTFPPTKKPNEEPPARGKNAIETLEYVLDAMKRGDTNAEGIAIVWNATSGDMPPDAKAFHLRYMVGGSASIASVIGMIEMAKQDMLE